MPTESPRHYLLSPLAAAKARLFLIQQTVKKAADTEVAPATQQNLLEQLELLTKKVDELQNRIEETLAPQSTN